VRSEHVVLERLVLDSLCAGSTSFLILCAARIS